MVKAIHWLCHGIQYHLLLGIQLTYQELLQHYESSQAIDQQIIHNRT